MKPWRQKGTGRARAGSTRSPVWRHGGTVFGPRPRDYSYTLPRKVRREALKAALRLRAREGSLRILDTLDLAEPRTKGAVRLLEALGLPSALIVLEGGERNLELAARNLPNCKTIRSAGLNVYDILRYEGLVMGRETAGRLEELLR